MPGPPHIIRSPALLGINESTRSELIDFGTNNLRAENVRQNHTGEAGTRFGFAALPNARLDGTSPVAGYKLISDHASPVRICDGQIESYSSKAAAWSTLGRVSECSASLTSLVSLGASGTLEDVDATANGYIALSWLVPDSASNSTAYAAIVDQATGAVVRAPEAVTASLFYSATISTPMLLGVIGNKFVAVRISTGNRLLAWSLDATSPATIAAGWVAYGAALCSDATYGYALHSLATSRTGCPRKCRRFPWGTTRAYTKPRGCRTCRAVRRNDRHTPYVIRH